MDEPLKELMTEDEYDECTVLYECGLRLVQTQVENASQIMELSDERNIYDSIESRIKDYDSVIDKCTNKKKIEPTLANVKKNIYDIAGLRIITLFLSDVYRIRDAIEKQPGLEILEEKDYVKKRKESGYRSLHLIVSVQVPYRGVTKSVPVEIQIRTKAMDVWASIEHDLRYRKKGAQAGDADIFAETAKFLEEFDFEADRIAFSGRENINS